jgi:hypothetical protein
MECSDEVLVSEDGQARLAGYLKELSWFQVGERKYRRAFSGWES